MRTENTGADQVTIERATDADVQGLLELLARTDLPSAGVLEHLPTMLVARGGGRVVGSAGLELYADGALLRSVAVNPDLHRTGVGGRLVHAAMELARAHGVPAIYLLTTTAEEYFPRFGFARIDRSDVPASVQRSVEFRSACPASAAVLRKCLDMAQG